LGDTAVRRSAKGTRHWKVSWTTSELSF